MLRVAARFHLLTKAYDVLTDEKLRAAFDEVIRARIERQKRTATMDQAKRKLRDELMEREQAAKKHRESEETKGENLKKDLQRLREEGIQRQKDHERELQEARDRSRQTANRATNAVVDELDRTLKFKWKVKKIDFDQQQLHKLLSGFGEIENLVISAKKGSALCVFKSLVSAVSIICSIRRHKFI